MPFITGGFPRSNLLGPLLRALDSAGADIVEVGIPFSDPIADGPVIAASMHEALQRGATPESIMHEVRAVRDDIACGVIAMVSCSIVHAMGERAFLRQLREHGFDGVIVPDIDAGDSPSPGARLSEAAGELDMSCTFLIAPGTPPERAAALASLSRGFVYLLARVGITGERSEVPDVAAQVQRLREVTDLPIAVGFGISTREHVLAVHQHADAAIVGSALVRRMGEAEDPVAAAGDFVRSLVDA